MIEQQEDNVPIDFIFRVLRNHFRELHYWNDAGHFTIGKGTTDSADYWYCWTPKDGHYGDTASDVIRLAEKDYPDIRQWLDDFNER